MDINSDDGWDDERALTRDANGNYIKTLTERQRQYYEQYGNVIKDFHAPYVFMNNRNDPKLVMKPYGRPIDIFDEDGKEYALDALKKLHDNGVYHGDILSGSISSVKMNRGNILVDENNNYKLIDFGPIGNDMRNDEELLNVEKQLIQEYKRGPPSVKRRKRRPKMSDNDNGNVGRKLFFGGKKKSIKKKNMKKKKSKHRKTSKHRKNMNKKKSIKKKGKHRKNMNKKKSIKKKV